MTDIINKIEDEAKKIETAIAVEVKEIASEVYFDAAKVEHAVVNEAEKIYADVKDFLTPTAAPVEPVVAADKTPAPQTAVAPTSQEPSQAGYSGVPKTNPSVQTLAPTGKSRYKADGLTIDWYDTHPRE